MRYILFFCALIGLSAVAGCVSTRFVPTGNRYSPWDGPVKVLREFPENEEYEEVGWISAKIDKEFDDLFDWGDVLVALQKEARKRGANAIVIVEREVISGHKAEITSLGGKSESTTEKGMVVIAIRIWGNSGKKIIEPERKERIGH